MTTAAKNHDVADLSLADAGQARIEWADRHMPVLASIRERFAGWHASSRRVNSRANPSKSEKKAPWQWVGDTTRPSSRTQPGGDLVADCCCALLWERRSVL